MAARKTTQKRGQFNKSKRKEILMKTKKVLKSARKRIGKTKKVLQSVRKHVAKLKQASLKRLQKHYGFIKKLHSVSEDLKKVKKLLKNATPGEILALAEIVLNLLRRNIPLTDSQKHVLCPHRSKLRQVASKRTNCEEKRKVFTNQKGGILGIIGTIISAAIPAIKGLISAFTS
jgi:hypothetical protein